MTDWLTNWLTEALWNSRHSSYAWSWTLKAIKGHLDTQGTKELGHSRHSDTKRALGHSGTPDNWALGHWGTWALRQLGTWALEALEVLYLANSYKIMFGII